MKSRGLVFCEKPTFGVEPTRLYDQSRYGNHGTYTNITNVQLPRGLWVRRFNGTSSLVTCGRVPALEGVTCSYTMSFWLKLTDNLTDSPLLFGYGPGNTVNPATYSYSYWGSAADNLYTSIGVGAVESTIDDFDDLAWHHLILQRSSTTSYVYEDGVATAKATTVENGIPVNAANVLKMGDDFQLDFFKGEQALWNIWDYKLSIGQIQAIYEGERRYFGK